MTLAWSDLRFESDIIGRTTARLHLSPGPSAEAVRAARVGARDEGVDHLVATVRSDDEVAARALVEAGFELVDTSIRLHRALLPEPGPPIPEVRRATGGDRQILVARCFALFRLSRFYRDPFFTEVEADDIHRHWVGGSFGEGADTVFVADDFGAPVAFLSAVLDEAGSTARIDLLAVIPEAARRGHGRRLTEAALQHYGGRAERIVVKTQSDNVAALRLYEGAGFRPHATELTFAATTG